MRIPICLYTRQNNTACISGQSFFNFTALLQVPYLYREGEGRGGAGREGERSEREGGNGKGEREKRREGRTGLQGIGRQRNEGREGGEGEGEHRIALTKILDPPLPVN